MTEHGNEVQPGHRFREVEREPGAHGCAPVAGVESQALLAGVRGRSPALNEAVELAEASTVLVRRREAARLDDWLQQAENSAVPLLQRFATRLWADHDAVRAALPLAWSNGRTEGQTNRLKTLKRQMYGRASLDLLERRFLLAA